MHQVSSAITAMEARIEREDDEEKAREQRQDTAKGDEGVLKIMREQTRAMSDGKDVASNSLASPEDSIEEEMSDEEQILQREKAVKGKGKGQQRTEDSRHRMTTGRRLPPQIIGREKVSR